MLRMRALLDNAFEALLDLAQQGQQPLL